MLHDQRDAAYLWDMLDAANQILSLVAAADLNQYSASLQLHLSVERLFITIGEAARRVSQESRSAYPDIPWQRIIGLRNIVVHNYSDIRDEVLFDAANADLPLLAAQIKQILAAYPPERAG